MPSTRPPSPSGLPPLASPAALVLAGGGARGAYEAGVMRYVLDTLPRKTGVEARFDTFAGTSVGALNTSFLAATAHRPARSSQDLAAYWNHISMDKVIRYGVRDLFRLAELITGRRWEAVPRRFARAGRPHPGAHLPVQGVFDTTPLHREMREVIPWRSLQRNIADGTLRGVALCATEVCTGKAVIFHQTRSHVSFQQARDPSKRSLPVWLGPDHALASAAIPFLFPSVQVDRICYVDGALHLNTPLFPAIRMGAERILVVSLSQEPRIRFNRSRMGCRSNAYPGAVFLLGRIVGAFTDQALDHELHRLEMFNELLATGDRLRGERFRANMAQVTRTFRNAAYRTIHTLHIRPSRDLNEVAVEAIQEAPEELLLPGPVGRGLQKVLLSRSFLESELTSYILFTPTYARKLLRLGYEDARRRREELAAFFGATPAGGPPTSS